MLVRGNNLAIINELHKLGADPINNDEAII
jgi:hypothetical protein